MSLKQESLSLKAGDYLLIPARARHRVASCSQDALWLALHVKAPEQYPAHSRKNIYVENIHRLRCTPTSIITTAVTRRTQYSTFVTA